MREIKFRVWDRVTACWTKHGVFGNKGYAYIHPEGGAASQLEHCLAHPESFAVMQYTGLKDKNGIEIYEGDILASRDSGKPFIVKHTECELVDMSDEWVTGLCIPDYGGALRARWAVVGNIYENPELLK